MTRTTSAPIRFDYRRYVGEAGHRKLADAAGSLVEGRECELTVLLADVKSFTTFSETHTPAEVIAILDVYFDVMVNTVFEYGGAVDKYIGDCVMTIFGAPVETADHAKHAVRCAVEIRKRVQSLSSDRKKSGLDAIEVGYAANTGLAVAGHIGCAARRDYSVIGDTVNICSRIEDFVHGEAILVGQNTYTQVRNIVRARKHPVTKVKGRAGLVHIYEIMDINEK